MTSVTLNSGKVFKIDTGISILDAAARNAISLPYSCKTGRCSTCKCKVMAGESLAMQEEFGLTPSEKAAGWILSCVRAATTDLVLEVEDLGGVKLPEIKTLPCRISSIEQLAPDVIRVLLRLPPSATFEFIPGQYIDAIGPDGLRRSYSLARASYADKQLELHIRAVQGGAMSQYWFGKAKADDLLRLNGPMGTFFLRDVTNLDLVFLATGTGVAPVKAMLESLANVAAEEQPRTVTVIWGGRTKEDLYLDMAGIPGNFTFVPVLSRPTEQWLGASGYVQQILLSIMPDLSNAAVYACGSDAMIQSAKTSLMQASLPSNRFYSDAFVCTGSN
jgi:CDP-4-dehydro-6-deoxyglucose reductase, E3